MSAARKKQGRNASSTLLIVDSQSVKNTDTADLKDYDAGKNISGIKCHIAVALQAFERSKAGLQRTQSVLCDGGYVGQPFAQGVREVLGEHVIVQITKRGELHRFELVPQRWMVERSFTWLEKSHR